MARLRMKGGHEALTTAVSLGKKSRLRVDGSAQVRGKKRQARGERGRSISAPIH